MPGVRRLLVDGIDTLLIDPRSTNGQPDGWGWDWERWCRPVRGKAASGGAKAAA